MATRKNLQNYTICNPNGDNVTLFARMHFNKRTKAKYVAPVLEVMENFWCPERPCPCCGRPLSPLQFSVHELIAFSPTAVLMDENGIWVYDPREHVAEMTPAQREIMENNPNWPDELNLKHVV